MLTGGMGSNFLATAFANSIPSPAQTISASLVGRPSILSLTNPPIRKASTPWASAASAIFFKISNSVFVQFISIQEGQRYDLGNAGRSTKNTTKHKGHYVVYFVKALCSLCSKKIT